MKNPARDIGESVQLSHIEDTPQNKCMLCDKTQADVGVSKVHLNLFCVDLTTVEQDTLQRMSRKRASVRHILRFTWTIARERSLRKLLPNGVRLTDACCSTKFEC